MLFLCDWLCCEYMRECVDKVDCLQFGFVITFYTVVINFQNKNLIQSIALRIDTETDWDVWFSFFSLWYNYCCVNFLFFYHFGSQTAREREYALCSIANVVVVVVIFWVHWMQLRFSSMFICACYHILTVLITLLTLISLMCNFYSWASFDVHAIWPFKQK